jgi:hypothetical protein
MTPQLGRLLLIGSGIAIVLGVFELIRSHVPLGVLLIALGSVPLVGVLKRTRDRRIGLGQATASGEATSFQLIKAYAFFSILALGGIAVFLLAVVGAIKEPVFYGPVGLVVAAIATYVLVHGHYHRDR